jgi:uncharacterized protein YcbX
MAMRIPKRAGATAGVAALAVEIARLRVAAISTNVHASALHGPANLNVDPPTVAAFTAPAVASDLATSLTLCNWIVGVARQHFADTSAHKVADATSLPVIGAAVDLGTAQTAANLVKASLNTHEASTTYHYTADAANLIAAADASNQGTLNTLLNEIRTDLLAHGAAALAGYHVELVDS